jgi:hypothetical protein
MRVMVDERVEQTLRHLSPREAARLNALIEHLKSQTFESFRARPDVQLRGQEGKGRFYAICATDRLRIICRWMPNERALYIEDVVSRNVLDRYFVPGRSFRSRCGWTPLRTRPCHG